MQAGDVAPLGRARLPSTLSELVKFWGGGWESQETLGLGRPGLRQGVMLWLRESKGTIVFPGGVPGLGERGPTGPTSSKASGSKVSERERVGKCVRKGGAFVCLGWEDPLKKSMATPSSILAWRIPMDRGTWWATVHGVTKNQTQLGAPDTPGSPEGNTEGPGTASSEPLLHSF